MERYEFKLPGKIKNICLLLALNMVVACGFAQVNITGKVSGKSGDQSNGVSGISVVLRGT